MPLSDCPPPGLLPTDPDALDGMFMQRAIALAARGRGRVSPNPPVGCVLVRDGAVVGEGWHAAFGDAHAERMALAEAGDAARGACAYVTLMPCAHTGKTPPCTEALIRAGVREVVVAVDDPDPVSRDGAAVLRGAGVRVRVGVCAEDAAWGMRGFLRCIRTGLPHVTLKYAMTLDGCTATHTGESQWISGEESRVHVQALRTEQDAVLVGIGTLRGDDPQLNVRIPDAPQPKRVVVDAQLETPPDARIFSTPGGAVFVLATTLAASDREARLREVGATILRTSPTADGRVDLPAALRALADAGVREVLCEGGAGVAGGLWRAGLVGEVVAFVAPRILGGGMPVLAGRGAAHMPDATCLRHVSIQTFGSDVCVHGRVPEGEDGNG